MRGLSQNDLDWFAARLSIAVYDTNREFRLGVQEIKEALRHLPGIDALQMQYGAGTNQIYILDDVRVELPASATAADIESALTAPVTPLPPLVFAAPAATPGKSNNMSITGLQQGLIQTKLAELRQKAQQKLNDGLAKIDAAQTLGLAKVDAEMDGAVAKIDKEIADQLQEFATFTNGGPA